MARDQTGPKFVTNTDAQRLLKHQTFKKQYAMIISRPDVIAEVDAVDKNEWSRIVASFEDASIYQTWSYGSVQWGEGRLSHVVLKNDGEVAAAAQVRIARIPGLGAGIAYVKWGPMWRRPTNSLKQLEQIVRSLRSEYVTRRGLFVRIIPNEIDGESADMATVLEREGLARNLQAPPYRSVLVDLSHSLEELRKGMSKSWRYTLKRAEEKELEIIEGVSDELFDAFVELYREMRTLKKYAEFFDINKYKTIQQDLPDRLRMSILICTYKREPIAGAVISRIGLTALNLLSAAGAKGRELGAAYRLQWRAIEMLKASGARWYDLGGINPEHNPGCYQFKASLAGRFGTEVHYVGQFEDCGRLRNVLTIRTADYLRNTFRRMTVRVSEARRAIL